MRAFRWTLTLMGLVILAGCGLGNLVLKVDVLSYVDQSKTVIPFGPVPAFPGGMQTGEQDVVSQLDVNLLEGTNSITEVKDVSISMTILARDSTGAGSDTLRVDMSSAGTDPKTTPAVVQVPLVFSPGATDTVHVEVAGDSRVAGLFSGKHLWVTLTTSLHGPGSGASLNGELALTSLDAVLVAARKRDL